MTKLDEVPAEGWTSDNVELSRTVLAGDGRDLAPADGREATRTAVALLGKRALAWLLKSEHDFPGGAEGQPCCAECGRGPPWEHRELGRVQGHKPDCEIGAIVEEARRLG